MAEDKTKKPALDLGSLATGGTQDELQEEQLDEVAGGSSQRGTGTSGLGGIAVRHAIALD